MYRNKRIVIKVGTKVITSRDRALDKDAIAGIVRQIADIQDKGAKVILVTSGAIGAGMWLLQMKKRPSDLGSLQAAASIGQSHLMHLYGEYFKARGYLVGQILLTQEDFNDRKRYLNIKHTISTLLANGAVPVINENDTVATDEIKCGDNDRLSSLVADVCGADLLVMLTDIDGLLDENGNVVREVGEVTNQILKLGGKSRCDLGTGGMATKLESARNVTHAGIGCVIANGKEKEIILRIMNGEAVGTTFLTGKARFIAKKRWIAFSSRAKGAITVDDGAAVALKKNKSLLASGITGIVGNFAAGDVIGVAGKDGREFARGVTNYTSDDLAKIKGAKTDAFRNILGYKGPDEVIHKDNLVILH